MVGSKVRNISACKDGKPNTKDRNLSPNKNYKCDKQKTKTIFFRT